MKKLRVGIIGQGRSGRNIHGRCMELLPRQFQVVAACDPIKKRRDRAAEQFGCDTYKDYKAMLKRDDLDLVINASPSHLHAPIALDVIKAGFNQVCEKPLARKAKDVDKLIAAQKKTGKLFTVYQQARLMPYFQQVKKVIDSGVLGRVTQIAVSFSSFGRRWDWQTLTEFNGGNLQNTGPHPLDQALQLMGVPLNEVPKVACAMDSTHFWGDAEGHVNLMLTKPGHPIITLEINSDAAYPRDTYIVTGTQGGLRASMLEMEWKYYDPKTAPKHKAGRKPIITPEGLPSYCGAEKLKWTTKKWKNPKSKANLFDAGGVTYYKNIYSHLTKGEETFIKVEEIRQQAAVIEECCKQNPHIWGGKKPGKMPAAEAPNI
jgi:predicted dehydrogenase